MMVSPFWRMDVRLSNALTSFRLLLRMSHLLLNMVEKGVLYISHILSRNKIEGGEFVVTMSRRVT